MTNFELTWAWGRDRPSWAPHADEPIAEAIGEEAGGDPALGWRVIQVCGNEELVIIKRPGW
jgi:hypothetical protein